MADRAYDLQGPTSGKIADSYGAYMRIVEHPAFRIGFLDAQNGLPFDHDDIMGRIARETPPRALERINWKWAERALAAEQLRLFDRADHAASALRVRARAVELAQYRYEEGRLAVLALGLRCRAWGHPDYPPTALRRYVDERIAGRAPSLTEAA